MERIYCEMIKSEFQGTLQPELYPDLQAGSADRHFVVTKDV